MLFAIHGLIMFLKTLGFFDFYFMNMFFGAENWYQVVILLHLKFATGLPCNDIMISRFLFNL